MKISLLIPDGTRNTRQFAKAELAQAKNIKNKATRKSVESGLRLIINNIGDTMSSIAVFTDGSEILI